jgi:phosphomannomutase
VIARLVADAGGLAPLRDPVTERPYRKVSVDCPDDRKAAVVDALGDDIPDAVAGTDVDSVNDADGFKLLLVDGSWLLVRPSGTEPKLRVYAEADSDERVDELLVAGRELVAPLV